MTEAWDANPNSSQNHFMLGHAEEWFYRGLAGIQFDLDRSRDERITIHPAIVGNIHSAKATFRSSLGEIESGWSISGDAIRMTVIIPQGTTATIVLPPGFTRKVRVNGSPLRTGGAILNVKSSSGSVRCVVRSGTFSVEASNL